MLFVCIKEKQKRMDMISRTQQLKTLFSYEHRVELEEKQLEIIPFHFSQTMGAQEIDKLLQIMPTPAFSSVPDNGIEENKNFNYIIFAPKRQEKHKEAILLLHGLNERSWEKYLTWAEYLAENTGKAVILFPIAFHMNRTPTSWHQPRAILPWAVKRKESIENLCNSSFANAALSSRISGNPLRFYASGKETVYNIWQLTHEIKNGNHPLFSEDTSVNIFAYSIGALVSQVTLLANPENLFAESKLFMFCGGSIFSEMNGNSRDIMDQEAFSKLQQYFQHDFLNPEKLPSECKDDFLEQAFKSMINPSMMREYRENFFHKACTRIRAISLKKDIVMPTQGIINALGKKCADVVLKELDFPFDYSHQIPFPSNNKTAPSLVDNTFRDLFGRVASFL
jgi:hypothetical protein